MSAFVINPQTLSPRDALELLQDSMGEVIDLCGSEGNPDRPCWATDALRKLRELEFFLGEIVGAERAAEEAQKPEAAE